MIRIERISKIPLMRGVDPSKIAMVQAGSDRMFAIGEFVVVGEFRSSFTSPPYIWLLLSDEWQRVSFTVARQLKYLAVLMEPGSLVLVVNDRVPVRFVEWFGFAPTGEQQIIDGQVMEVMRRD